MSKDKKYILALIMLLPLLLCAITRYVDDDYTNPTPPYYDSIQEAIGDASTGDVLCVYPGTYEHISIGNIGLTIMKFGIGDVIIDGNDEHTCIYFTSNSQYGVILDGLIITNGNNSSGGGIYAGSDRTVKICNCEIINNTATGGGGGLFSSQGDLTLEKCVIKNNTAATGGGIYARDQHLTMQDVSIIDNTAEVGGGIYAKTYATYVNYLDAENVIIENNTATDYAGALGIRSVSPEVPSAVLNFNKVTISNNNCTNDIGGIYIGTPTYDIDLSIINSIVWGNDNTPQIPANHIVTYSCVDGNTVYPGDENINDDPEFVNTNTYNLEYYSPCIDTGDDDIAYYDPDGSRADMGYLYHEQDVYSWQYGLFERQYLWKSFPKLQIDPNQGDDVGVENSLQTWNPLPHQLELDIWNDDGFLANGIYDDNEERWTWDDEDISSVKGYKMQKTNASGCLLFSRGVICESDTDLDTYASAETWLGYFLEDSQLVIDAFPSAVINDAILVKTMDWTISRNSTNDRWTGTTGSSYINYADCVVIETVSAYNDFNWETPSRSGYVNYRPVAEHFTFDDDVDYFPIYATFDVNDMPDEVAVYIDGVCHGAQVVEDTICQICAHILEEDPGQEIEFALWYDGRSGLKHLNSYQVFNESEGKYERRSLITGMPGIHYKVYLEGNNENVVPIYYDLHCYPNPFNPELTISFNLEETQEVNLNVYNVKGQKVKTLVNELFRPDDYNLVWKGDDNTGNKVSSGVYYIRLQVGEDIVNRKVILMK
ncbi:MAG: T9SS type A sorting domain-containing protein [Candidatus Stygibacter australis]|nr:T9SS type A sorting domain-containing protein [Candidatus Stygibacter australis]MDP8321976.1 T9SS type A sorting domain-containing protein [Candidatus Stygibacter australis]